MQNLNIKSHKLMGILWAQTGAIVCIVLRERLTTLAYITWAYMIDPFLSPHWQRDQHPLA